MKASTAEQAPNKCPATIRLLSTCLFSLSNLTSLAGVSELKCSALLNISTFRMYTVRTTSLLCCRWRSALNTIAQHSTDARVEGLPISSFLRPGSHCVSHPGEGRHASLEKSSKGLLRVHSIPSHRSSLQGLRMVIPGSCSNAQKLQGRGCLGTHLQ